MSNPVGGRARDVFTVGAFAASIAAVATASCTYDYQGALGAATASSAASGGASSSSSAAQTSASSAGGSGGAGGDGGATQSSSTGGAIACADFTATITHVTGGGGSGQSPWKACDPGGDLTGNLQPGDDKADCVKLSQTNKHSHLLSVDFSFAGLPSDAAVSAITVTLQRTAGLANAVQDDGAWFVVLDTLHGAPSMSTSWIASSAPAEYTLSKPYAPGAVTGAQFRLRVVDSTNQDVTAKVGQAKATVSYSSAACP